MAVTAEALTYQQRIETLYETKLEQARAKRDLLGAYDHDEQGRVLPPEDAIEIREAISGSGEVVKDAILKDFKPEPNHPSGGFFGPKAVGENFRRLLEVHPTYIDPVNSMAGRYMVNFNSYRKPGWNPDISYDHLKEDHETYHLRPGIGGLQHFCPDLKIGLDLGWGGLLEKVRRYRDLNPDPETTDFYDGLENILLGVQDWLQRHADEARRMAQEETNPVLRENLEEMADICERQMTEPPQTFRGACQWLTFFQAVAKMFNGSGEWGQLDELLRPYYERDMEEGILTEDEAIFHIACLLLSETAYIQLGGPDAMGRDKTSRVSFLVLEAVHRLQVPANITVRVGDNLDPNLFRRGVEILFEDKMGMPKFLGDKSVNEGFVKSGFPIELARDRIYSGCHWLAIPGREYTLNDVVKIDLARVFEVAMWEMMEDETVEPSVDELWERFQAHLTHAVHVIGDSLEFHLTHMPDVFPELVLDLFCYGPVEKGLDASDGMRRGLEFYNMCCDGSSLATAADSFAALKQRVEDEALLSWDEMAKHLESDWEGPDGERARLMMKNIERFGSGRSMADEWAKRISDTYTQIVRKESRSRSFNMLPGLFSWASQADFGRLLGATPNGRHAGDPASHGPNPEPGFNRGKGGTPTQMVVAVANVQPGFGNTAPLQLDMDPNMGKDEGGLEKVEALLRSYFDLGGTLVNINVLNKEKILAAHKNPSQYPDLIVRVTGFSAYFANLSEELRQLVVDRVVSGT
jgi:formate C-acetyltransferase